MGWFYFLTIYILVIALITSGVKDVYKKNKITILLGFGMLAFFAMFHSDSVGNDTKTYLYAFEIANSSEGISDSYGGYEIGFIWLLRILAYISDDPQVLIITIGAFVYFSYSRFVLKYSKLAWLSLYLFFTLGYFDFSLSGLRQTISTAILLYAYDYIIQKKPFRFLCIIVIAALFHNAAWVFIVAYFISYIKNKKEYLVILSIGTIIVNITFNTVLGIVFRVFPKYSYYLGGETTDGIPRIATLFNILVLILMVSIELFSKYKSKSILDNRVDHVNFLYVVTAISILIASTNATAITRCAQIFKICSIIYFPNVISRLENHLDKALIKTTCIFLFFIYIWIVERFKTPEWQTTYPFSFFWE